MTTLTTKSHQNADASPAESTSMPRRTAEPLITIIEPQDREPTKVWGLIDNADDFEVAPPGIVLKSVRAYEQAAQATILTVLGVRCHPSIDWNKVTWTVRTINEGDEVIRNVALLAGVTAYNMARTVWDDLGDFVEPPQYSDRDNQFLSKFYWDDRIADEVVGNYWAPITVLATELFEHGSLASKQVIELCEDQGVEFGMRGRTDQPDVAHLAEAVRDAMAVRDSDRAESPEGVVTLISY